MERLDYFIRRLLLMVPTFLGITFVCFALCQVVPGGPVEQALAKMRGLGAADLAYAIRNGRPPRCGTGLAFHTYEAAAGLVISCDTQRTYSMTSRCERPAPFEPGYIEYPELVMDLY